MISQKRPSDSLPAASAISQSTWTPVLEPAILYLCACLVLHVWVVPHVKSCLLCGGTGLQEGGAACNSALSELICIAQQSSAQTALKQCKTDAFASVLPEGIRPAGAHRHPVPHCKRMPLPHFLHLAPHPGRPLPAAALCLLCPLCLLRLAQLAQRCLLG